MVMSPLHVLEFRTTQYFRTDILGMFLISAREEFIEELLNNGVNLSMVVNNN